MQDYQNLAVWHRSMALADRCFEVTGSFPASQQFGLSSQIQRAGVSIPSNIAEGCGRDSDREFARFLRIAYASACELETQVRIAISAGFGDRTQLGDLLPLLDEIRRMLNGLIGAVSRTDS